jgi:hypothetical protein
VRVEWLPYFLLILGCMDECKGCMTAFKSKRPGRDALRSRSVLLVKSVLTSPPSLLTA